MNVDLGLKKIDTLEHEKKNLMVKLFDAKELLIAIMIKNTYLRSKGKAIDVTFNDDEEFGHEFENDQEANFITFTATTVVGESKIVEENPSNGELSENAGLQKAYNKLCKIATKDAMNVDQGLKKIDTLEHEKKNLLVKLFDANELIIAIMIKNTYLRSKGKAIDVTFNDDEEFGHEFESDQEANFITFTATTVVGESKIVEENPSNGELFENAGLQMAYNKLCKIATKDAMNVDLGLKKIDTLEHEKKNLLVKLFDANELIIAFMIENMSLI